MNSEFQASPDEMIKKSADQDAYRLNQKNVLELIS
jgi:hypothetical protein